MSGYRIRAETQGPRPDIGGGPMFYATRDHWTQDPRKARAMSRREAEEIIEALNWFWKTPRKPVWTIEEVE